MTPLKLGRLQVDRIVELDTVWFDTRAFYPSLDEAGIAHFQRELGPRLMHPQTGHIALAFHSYLIRTPELTILVDTCNGAHKPRTPKVAWQHQLPEGEYLGNLARAGVRPEEVDLVMCTHLHCDHVGWNTRRVDGRWVPTFPNARYLMARDEFEHFDRLHRAGPDYPVNHGAWEDSVLPVVASGQAQIVEMRHQVEGALGDGVWIEPAPGHTPGHITVHLRAQGREAILSGDILHHPISMALPDLAMYADWDPVLGRATRRALLERCADTDTLLLTGHFPAPTAGHVISVGDAFAFSFAQG